MIFDWCLDNGVLIVGVEHEGVAEEFPITKEMILEGLRNDLLDAAADRTDDNLAALQEWSEYKMALRNLLVDMDTMMSGGVR